MSHVAYPDEMPIDCIKEAYAIIAAGQVVEKKEDLALCIWNIQGYAQKVILGDPNPLIGSEETTPEGEWERVHYAAVNHGDGKATLVEGKIDWSKVMQFLLKVAPLILPFILEPKPNA